MINSCLLISFIYREIPLPHYRYIPNIRNQHYL